MSACGFSALWLLHGCYPSWMGPRFLQTSWAHTLGKHEAGREEAQLVRAGISLHCPGELGRAPLLVRGTAMWKGVLGAALELGPGCGLHATRWGWPRLFPGRPATGFAPHSQPRDLWWQGGLGSTGCPKREEACGPWWGLGNYRHEALSLKFSPGPGHCYLWLVCGLPPFSSEHVCLGRMGFWPALC